MKIKLKCIGGYVPMAINSLPVSIQYVMAVGFLVAATVFSIMLARKKEN